MRFRCIVLISTLTGCTSGEELHVRDHGEVLFSGRIRKTVTLTQPERHRVGIGAEVGAFGTNGDYSSPTSTRDYRYTVGYAAFVTDLGIKDFTFRPKLGIGAVDVAVAGQSTTVGDDGLGVMFGLEVRHNITPTLDVFARGSAFQRSSLDSTMIEAGFGFYPVPNVVVECGYGTADVIIDDAFSYLNLGGVDLDVQGVMISLSLLF